MFLVKDPGQYQVIVTNNLFGDIVTDIGGALQGGLGMAASGNIHPGRTSLFEPVHGSAPPLAGKNVANPMGAILSAALMLETLGARDEAEAIERAVEAAVAAGQTTTDIGGTLGTREVGDWIAAATVEARSKLTVEADRIPMSRHVFILGGARTPMTQYVGALKDVSAIELGAIASRGALERTGVEARVDRSRRVRQRAAEQRRRALRRAARRPQGRPADRGAGADRQSPVRLRHPGRASAARSRSSSARPAWCWPAAWRT